MDGYGVGESSPARRYLVPAYVHPAVAPDEWAALIDRADELRLVVINLADGPGTLRDTVFDAPLALLRERGVRLAGYVDTDYGRVDPAVAIAEVLRWVEWFGVDTVFFDRVSTGLHALAYYAALAHDTREKAGCAVALNHGAPPDPEYGALAEFLGCFEGPWKDFLDLPPANCHCRNGSRGHFHLVTGVPPSRLGEACDLAFRRGADFAWATTLGEGNPWARLTLPS